MTLNVNATSSAVTGAPSLHCAPFRRTNVHVRPSLLVVHDPASAGSVSVVSPLSSTSPSNNPPIGPVDEVSWARMGLNVRGSLTWASRKLPPNRPGSPTITFGFGRPGRLGFGAAPANGGTMSVAMASAARTVVFTVEIPPRGFGGPLDQPDEDTGPGARGFTRRRRVPGSRLGI